MPGYGPSNEHRPAPPLRQNSRADQLRQDTSRDSAPRRLLLPYPRENRGPDAPRLTGYGPPRTRSKSPRALPRDRWEHLEVRHERSDLLPTLEPSVRTNAQQLGYELPGGHSHRGHSRRPPTREHTGHDVPAESSSRHHHQQLNASTETMGRPLSSQLVEPPASLPGASALTECPECPAIFLGLEDFRHEHLDRHLRDVHGAIRLPCPGPGCSSSFSDRESLNQHVQDRHPWTFIQSRMGL